MMSKQSVKLVAIILAIASIFSCFSFSVSAISASRSYISNGEYSILLHDDKSKCVNVIYASTEDDKAQIGVDPWDYQPHETWIIINRGSNYYTLSPKHAPHLCLNALFANKTPGDKVVLHHYTANDAASLWSFHSNGDGSYTLKNKATGLVLDLTNGEYSIGNRFIHWTSNNYLRAQGFYLNKLGSSSSATDTISSNLRVSISNGTYKLIPYSFGSRCLNIQYKSTAVYTSNCVLDSFNGESNEKFLIRTAGDRFYSISPAHCTNRYLCSYNGKLTLSSNSTSASSQWYFVKNGSYYSIINRSTGKALQVTSSYIGAPVSFGNPASTLFNQRFAITPVDTWCSPVPTGVYFNRKTTDYGTNPSWYGYHDINIGVDKNGNTPVYAVCEGTAVFKQSYLIKNGTKYLCSYGNHVVFTSSDGSLKIIMAHLDRFNGAPQWIPTSRTQQMGFSKARNMGYTTGTYTTKTMKVSAGDILGYIGKTGNASGVHLHIEVYKNNVRVDPTTIFKNLTR